MDLSDPLLYTLLEICSLKGVLPPLSAVRPYRAEDAASFCRRRSTARGACRRGSFPCCGRCWDRLPPTSGKVRAELAARADLRANLNAPGALHSVNQLKAALRGSLGSALAYNLNLGLFFDKVDPEAFAPYAFTKKWDGFHIWAEDGSVIVSTASPRIRASPSAACRSFPWTCGTRGSTCS